MTLETHEVLEVAQIAAIMSDNGYIDYFYQKAKDKEGGYIGVTYKIAEWALEFFLENRETNWEEKLDTEGCWDDCITNYAKQKIEQYDK